MHLRYVIATIIAVLALTAWITAQEVAVTPVPPKVMTGSDLGFRVEGLRGNVEQTPNALRHYAMVLRRRWRWIALGLVMGLLAGIAATLVGNDTPDTTTYFKATNTLIYNAGRGSTPVDSNWNRTTPNLAQTVFLVRSADIVNGVVSAVG